MCLSSSRLADVTHPDVFTAQDVEGDVVTANVRASIGENQNHSVLLPHQLDGVGQCVLQGLASVRGLSQPAQVSHSPDGEVNTVRVKRGAQPATERRPKTLFLVRGFVVPPIFLEEGAKQCSLGGWSQHMAGFVLTV